MTTPDEIAAIARKLTAAQRRTILQQREPDGAGKWPLRHALVAKGLTVAWPHSWTLTRLGQQVRAYLETHP